MKTWCRLILVAALLPVAGCVTTKYEWGSYNTDLYKYYARSITQEELALRLQAVLQDCETNGKLVPPGLYGEYGYLLFETGKYNEAVVYFQKEHDKWPESRTLMAKMMRNCKAKTSGDQDKTTQARVSNNQEELKNKEPAKDEKIN